MPIAILLPLILSAAPSLISLVEGLFSKKPQSGQQKMDMVLQTIMTWLGQAIATGAIPVPQGSPNSINPAEVAAALETLLNQIKAQNGGTVPTGPTNPLANAFLLLGGTITPLKVAT